MMESTIPDCRIAKCTHEESFSVHSVSQQYENASLNVNEAVAGSVMAAEGKRAIKSTFTPAYRPGRAGEFSFFWER